MIKEIFKDVPGYEGKYQVSNIGRVKSLERWRDNGYGGYLHKERILKARLDKKGYLQVHLYKNYRKAFYIQSLMAMSFLGHSLNGTNKIVIDHINNIKTDNRIENLQLITNRENTSKDKNGCSSIYTGVYWKKETSKWVAAIRINGKKKYIGSFLDEYRAHLAYQEILTNHQRLGISGSK